MKKTKAQPVASAPSMAAPLIEVVTAVAPARSVTPYFLPRPYNERGQYLDLLDKGENCAYDPDALIDILIDAHPDAAKAVGDIIDLACTDMTFSATAADGQTSARATAWLEAFNRRQRFGDNGDMFVEDHTPEAFKRALLRSMLVKGCACAEIVVDADGNPSYFLVGKPGRVNFERDENYRLIPHWNDGTEYVKIDSGRFFYQKLENVPEVEYGVSRIFSLLTAVWQKVRLLTDLAQILKRVGFPRPSIEIVSDAIIKNAPAEIRNNAARLREYVRAEISYYQRLYKDIQPEDPLVHTDNVKITMLESKGGTAAFDVRSLMTVLDQQIASSLRTLPSLLGMETSKNTSIAAAMLQVFARGIAALQTPTALLLARMYTRALHLSGRSGYIDVLLACPELRSKTEIAQWESADMLNVCRRFATGAITFAEARALLRRAPGAPPKLSPQEEQEARETMRALAGAAETKPAERPGPNTAGGSGTDDE